MSPALTARQKEILEYLESYFRGRGYWPSIREIQSRFGFRSTNAVAGHLRALQTKGAIERVPGQARAFRARGRHGSEMLPLVELPVYGSIAAGYPDGVESGNALGRLQVDPETAGLSRSGRSFALRVTGDSMIDAGISDGDMVVIDPRPARNGDIVVALIDGQSTLKRFVQTAGRQAFLQSENQAFPAFHPVSELLIQGVATAVIRRL